ncbi:MAG: hypothetical protein ACLQVJ_29675 [Syntrophobacteraceae bacterium]
MRESKMILSALQTIQQKVLQAEVQMNGKRQELDQKKKALIKSESTYIGSKKVPASLSCQRREMSKLKDACESLGMLHLDLQEQVLRLQKELKLSELYETDITSYLSLEQKYSSGVKRIIHLAEAIRAAMREIQTLSGDLHGPAELKNLVSRLMAREELQDYDFAAFLDRGELILDEGHQNQIFKEQEIGIASSLFQSKIGRRFYIVPEGSLPTRDGMMELSEWRNIWLNVHERVFGKLPNQAFSEKEGRVQSTFRKIASSHPPDPFETRRASGGRVRS